MIRSKEPRAGEETKPAATLLAPQKPTESYAGLVQEFEETAEVLLASVTHLLDEAYLDHQAVIRGEWKREILFLAAELARYPWFLVNSDCPAPYETLRLFYRAWAGACADLESCLRTLVRKGDRRPISIRLDYASESLATVEAYTAARKVYLERLAGRVP